METQSTHTEVNVPLNGLLCVCVLALFALKAMNCKKQIKDSALPLVLSKPRGIEAQEHAEGEKTTTNKPCESCLPPWLMKGLGLTANMLHHLSIVISSKLDH